MEESLKEQLDLLKNLNETMAQLEKSGTLDRFLVDITAPTITEAREKTTTDMPTPDPLNTYEKISKDTLYYSANEIYQATEHLKMAKFWSGYAKAMYKDYKRRENEISQSDILKFIKDYEEDRNVSQES